MGKIKKEMLPRYYQLAKDQIGMQEVYNENENLFTFIKNINRLIDGTNKTIKVNGQDIDIKDYKIYLNNQILRESKYMEHDNQTIIGIFLGAFVPIILIILAEFNDKGVIFVIAIIIFILYLAFAIISYSRLSFMNRRTYVNNIGFYQIVLDMVNEI